MAVNEDSPILSVKGELLLLLRPTSSGDFRQHDIKFKSINLNHKMSMRLNNTGRSQEPIRRDKVHEALQD